MTVSSIKVKVQRKALVKLKVLPKFPANIEALNFLTITRSGNSYTFSVDYSVLTPGPISDPTTAYVAIEDATAGVYRTVTLSSLLTSGLDADLQAIAALTGTGILARTASNTWVLRTITGTANEITVTNGDGVSGAPTLSLPTALTFTGKTVTGGTFTGVTITSASYSGTLAGGTGLPISTGVSGLGTGIATALGVNVGTAGAPVINGGVLGTPSSGTATNITGLPISTGVSGLAAGAATFLATPSSANLRALLTDEVGTGAAYFVGGALGTPASGTATNLTGLPLSTGITGAGTGILTALAVNVGTAGAPVINGGVLGTPSSGTATNITGLPLSGLVAQGAFTLVGNNTSGSAVPTAIDGTALTLKASPGASDIVIIQDVSASNAFKKTTVSALGGGGAGVSTLNGQTGALVSYFPPQGRITLTSATPVMTSNVAAATTVYYTPAVGNIVPIYDGTNMIPTVVAEVSQATTDATKSPAAVANNSLYDLFVWNDSGTIRCTRGPAWTNTTTRSAGTALVVVNGIYLNNASITNGPAASRGTYVGTIASNGTATIDWIFGGTGAGGVAGFLMIWNLYNRELFSSFSGDTAASWTYATSNTWRAANNSSTIRTTIVRGLNVGEVEAKYSAVGNPNTTATVNIYCGIGLDSTTAVSGTSGYVQSPGATAVPFQCSGEYSGAPNAGGYTGIGQHYLSAVESQNFTTTTTWFGFASGAYQTGITVKTWQ